MSLETLFCGDVDVEQTWCLADWPKRTENEQSNDYAVAVAILQNLVRIGTTALKYQNTKPDKAQIVLKKLLRLLWYFTRSLEFVCEEFHHVSDRTVAQECIVFLNETLAKLDDSGFRQLAKTGKVSMPAETFMELLIHLAYYDKSQDQPSPQGIQNMVLQQITNDWGPATSSKQPGHPIVIFVCTNHKGRLVTGASNQTILSLKGRNTPIFGKITQNLCTLRDQRFAAVNSPEGTSKKAIEDKWKEPDVVVKTLRTDRAWFKTKNLTEQQVKNWMITYDENERRQLQELVREYLEFKLAPWAPFNHMNCLGRSFAPIRTRSNPNPSIPDTHTWFDNIPRCMKCRILHEYHVDEEDAGEKANWNRATNCAEDVCHSICARVAHAESSEA